MDKNIYSNSTQKRNWIYSQSKLATILVDKIKKIVERISKLPEKKYIKSKLILFINKQLSRSRKKILYNITCIS